MHEVKALIRPERLNDVIQALRALPDMPGITVSTVRGFGRRDGSPTSPLLFGEATMTKLETVVTETVVDQVVDVIRQNAHTGCAGDGKIFVISVRTAVLIRSGAAGEGVL